ncbi:MAG TPA: hypothetical protein VHY09_11150 [Candidatus Methylacidiphilales bacterium]|jgi:hypothetical protein|nr:hypothetical protein [Candidatus Methylacidiphilales bacterium]
MRLALLLLLAFTVATSRADAYPLYHDISDTSAAQAEAHERKLPVAYLGVIPGVLEEGSPSPTSDAGLAQMALNVLQGRAVVITFNGLTMANVPDFVHAQFHIGDDGPLKGGAAWLVPKIVFTDPGITKILGRVSHTQIAADGEVPIDTVLNTIQNNPTSLAPQPPPAPAAASDSSATTESAGSNGFGTLLWSLNLIQSSWPYFAAGGAVLVIALIALTRRKS